jgi:hypothetical protein
VFQALHRRRKAADGTLHAFDLLELNGNDLCSLPLRTAGEAGAFIGARSDLREVAQPRSRPPIPTDRDHLFRSIATSAVRVFEKMLERSNFTSKSCSSSDSSRKAD